jgi:hypothetical protein
MHGKLNMNNQKTLLISLLVTATAIGLVETNVVQLKDSYLYAEPEKTPLILKKGEDVFVIEPGEQVIINDNVYTYMSVDVASQTLIMENVSIPMGDISAIHYVTGTKMKERGLKGLKTGGLVGAAVGAVLGSYEGYYHYLILTVPMCAAVDGVALGIVGAGIGFTKKNSQAYALGDKDWRITNE